MKIKIGEIPLKLYNKICDAHIYEPALTCEGCPFAEYIPGSITKCKGATTARMDDVIDIPDEFLEEENGKN